MYNLCIIYLFGSNISLLTMIILAFCIVSFIFGCIQGLDKNMVKLKSFILALFFTIFTSCYTFSLLLKIRFFELISKDLVKLIAIFATYIFTYFITKVILKIINRQKSTRNSKNYWPIGGLISLFVTVVTIYAFTLALPLFNSSYYVNLLLIDAQNEALTKSGFSISKLFISYENTLVLLNYLKQIFPSLDFENSINNINDTFDLIINYIKNIYKSIINFLFRAKVLNN